MKEIDNKIGTYTPKQQLKIKGINKQLRPTEIDSSETVQEITNNNEERKEQIISLILKLQ